MHLTMQQLAEQLDLSIGTVSRALAGDTAIAAATRARVAEAAKRLGYQPNTFARALTTGRTRIIGIHLANYSSFFVEMALRLERVVSADGYMPVVHAFSARIAAWRPDGEIVLGEDMPPETTPGMPRVGSGAHPAHDYVSVSFLDATAEGVRHLVKTGCRRIAALVDLRPIPEPSERERGYSLAMEEAGLEPMALVLGGPTRADGRAAILGFCKRAKPPDAVICHNDDTAIGAYRACLDLGLRIPEDVSIIGCDGVEIGAYIQPPLSTIVQPLDERAALYWRFLKERLASPERAQQAAELPARLLLRGTTRPARA